MDLKDPMDLKVLLLVQALHVLLVVQEIQAIQVHKDQQIHKGLLAWMGLACYLLKAHHQKILSMELFIWMMEPIGQMGNLGFDNSIHLYG